MPLLGFLVPSQLLETPLGGGLGGDSLIFKPSHGSHGAKLSHGPIRFSGCVGGEASRKGWDQHETFGGSGQGISWIFQSWLPQYLMPHTRNPPRKKPGYPRLHTHPHLLDVKLKVQSLPFTVSPRGIHHAKASGVFHLSCMATRRSGAGCQG